MYRRSLYAVFALLGALAQSTSGCIDGDDVQSPAAAPTVTSASTYVVSGQTVQLTATFNGSPVASPAWYVNGVQGGTAQTGTVTSEGAYTAPALTKNTTFEITAAQATTGAKATVVKVTVVAPGVVSMSANPQVASYTWTTPTDGKVSVEFGTGTSYGRKTSLQAAPAGGGATTLLVAGMVANTDHHMRATLTFADGTTLVDQDHVFTTGQMVTAANFPAMSVTRVPSQTAQPGVELLDLAPVVPGGSLADTLVTDLDGNILWNYEPGVPSVGPNPVKLLDNGHFLINYAVLTPGTADGTSSLLQEVDLAGTLQWSLSADELNTRLATASCKGCNITVVGTHHDFLELANGHVIVLAAAVKSFTDLTDMPGQTSVIGDVIIDLDEKQNPVWLWSTFDYLDPNRHPMNFPDWTHSNALLYSQDDGAIVLSIRHQHWILKINYGNGTGDGSVLWKLGEGGDFTLNGGTDPQDWFYAQHGPQITSTSSAGQFQMIVFDNGNNRQLDPAGTMFCGAATPCSSRVVLLDLDETAKTANIHWSAAAPAYSNFGGDARVLANGNVEYDECGVNAPAPGSLIFEVTQTTTPSLVWALQVTGQYAYRGFRMPSMYPGVQW